MNLSSAFPHPDGFVLGNGFSLVDPFYQPGPFIETVGRNQDRDKRSLTSSAE